MNDTILRQWAMLRLIPRRPKKIATTTMLDRLDRDGFSTTLRTIQRDLNTLSTAFPLVSDNLRPQGWSWAIGAPQMDVPALDELSAVGFSLAESALDKIFPQATIEYLQPWFQSANRVLKKSSGSEESNQKYFRVVSRSLNLHPPKINPDIQEIIYQGVLKQTRVTLHYMARGETRIRQYSVHPLAVVIADCVCYLVCTINAHKDIRLLVLHRIQKASPTTEKCQRPRKFNLDHYLAEGNLGFLRTDLPIKVEFLMRRAWANHLAETPLSPNQSLKQIDDEWTKVTATAPDTSQLRWWLRGFGPDVEVLKPKTLREEFIADGETLNRRYGG